MSDIIAVSPSTKYDATEMKFLLGSAEKNNFKVDIIGLNQPFSWMGRMKWFQEYLRNLPVDTNPIVCFTDAYDVF